MTLNQNTTPEPAEHTEGVDWDLEKMKEAVNAPSVRVPDNINSDKEFRQWITSLTDDDFLQK